MKKHIILSNAMSLDMYEELCLKQQIMIQICKNPDRFKYEKILVPTTRRGEYEFKLSELKKELERL